MKRQRTELSNFASAGAASHIDEYVIAFQLARPREFPGATAWKQDVSRLLIGAAEKEITRQALARGVIEASYSLAAAASRRYCFG